MTDVAPQDGTDGSAPGALTADRVVHDLLSSEAETASDLADANRELSNWARRYQEAPEEIERLKRGCGAHPGGVGYEHPECGFHWHGKDGLDVPVGPWAGGTREPLCPRCELARVTAELAAATEVPASDAEALAGTMYAAYVAVLRERGAGPIFTWEELGECEDPDDCACAGTVAAFLAAARVALAVRAGTAPGTLPDDDVHVDWHMTAAEQAQLFGALRQHADVPYIAALIAAGVIPPEARDA